MDLLVGGSEHSIPQKYIDYLDAIIASGGPQENEYQIVSDVLNEIYSYTYSHKNGLANQKNECVQFSLFIEKNWSTFKTTASMQGFARSKPNGYAGDFEIIERIYNMSISGINYIQRWDQFFYYSSTVRAVRARGEALRSFIENRNPVTLLSVGAGPGLDVCHAISGAANLKSIAFLDNDSRAIERARSNVGIFLGHGRCNKIEAQFIQRNALRFRTDQKFDLIWSSGLFDYLDDRLFVFLLGRLKGMASNDGTVVVGNFSKCNPDRAYMELVGNWFLIHRCEADLVRLAIAAGFELGQISVTSDPTGVNLFLVAGNVAK